MRAKSIKQCLSLVLIVLLVFTQMPMAAYAANGADSGAVLGYSVTAFEPLGADVAAQIVPHGTSMSALNLPDMLDAIGIAHTVGTQSDTAQEPPQESDITLTGVTWQSAPDYAPDTAGTYSFTAVLPQGYDLADGVSLPVIAITVISGAQSRPSVIFDMPLNDFGETAFYLPEKEPITVADLLAGVSAKDETGEPVVVTVGDLNGLDMNSPVSKSVGYPPEPYIITYEAAHPVMGNVFSAAREVFVTSNTVVPLIVGAPSFDQTNNRFYANGTAIVIKQNGGIVSAYDSTGNTLLSDTYNLANYVIYGGWESGDETGDTSITIESGTLNNTVYGGSLNGTITGNTYVTVTGGTLGYLYGGSYGGAVTGSANISLTGGTIKGGAAIYGGGNQASATVGSTNISIENATFAGDWINSWNWVYGGGWAGPVTGATNITIDDCKLNMVCGGGNQSSATVGSTSITINDGEYNYVYGGGYYGSVTGNTVVNINDGTFNGDVKGGGASAPVGGNTAVYITDGEFSSVYGGGDFSAASVVGSATVSITGGTFYGSVYGGGNESPVGSTIVDISDGTINGFVYGGGLTASALVSGDTSVTLYGSAKAVLVAGGGVGGSVTGTTNVVIKGNAVIDLGVYGGSSGHGATVGNTEVTIQENADIGGNVHGGGEYCVINGNAVVNFESGSVKGRVYGCGVGGNDAADIAAGYGKVIGAATINVGADAVFDNVFEYSSNIIPSGMYQSATGGPGSQIIYGQATITYMVDGSVFATKTITINNNLMTTTSSLPDTIPTKYGHTFTEWFDISNVQYSNSTRPIIGNITLYAHWDVYNAAPFVTSVSANATAPVVGTAITGSYTFNAGTGTGAGADASTFKWYRGDTAIWSTSSPQAISGATSKIYTPTGADVGKYLYFEVTPTNGTLTGTPEQSTASGQAGIMVSLSVVANGTTGSATIDSGVGPVKVVSAASPVVTATIGDAVSVAWTVSAGGGSFSNPTIAIPTYSLPTMTASVTEPITITATFTADAPVKAVSVGTQSGTLTAGSTGTVTFPITTTNIANGSYTVSVANLPTGVTIQGSVTISGNSGTLTLAGNTSTSAGTTSNLTLTIDGVTSTAFMLTVDTTSPTVTFIVTSGASGISLNNPTNLVLTADDPTLLNGYQFFCIRFTKQGISGGYTLYPVGGNSGVDEITGLEYNSTTGILTIPAAVFGMHQGSHPLTAGTYKVTISFDDNAGGYFEYEVTFSLTSGSGGTTYRLTVNNGSGGGDYTAGAQVTITANAAPSGKVFDKWTGGNGGTFASAYSASTTFTMPGNAATVTATYKNDGSGDNNGGSDGGGYTLPSTTSTNIIVNTINVPYSKTGGSFTSNVAGQMLRNIVNNAFKNEDGGKTVKLDCSGVFGADKLTLTFDASKLKADEDVTFIIETPFGVFIFTTEQMLKWFGGNTFGSYTITLEKSSLKVDVKKGGVSAVWNSLIPMGRIGVPYIPKIGENTANLVVTDKNGRVLPTSVYEKGMIYADIFAPGTFKAVLTTPAAFTDAKDHWAKSYIDYVTVRGLISSTGNTTFAPNTAITRADFLMALGKLAGANVSGYKTSSFADVSNSSAAMPYIEWAVKSKIVTGIGGGKFAPNSPITREQMALMMTNYAKVLGYELPVLKTATAYADNSKISSWAKDAVTAMRKADIITGKDGNRFDPQGNATRAEAATILRRFVENVVSSRDAEGWSNANNDLNKRVYYNQNGIALTGWQAIGGARYYFGNRGIMHTGWLIVDDKRYCFYTNGKMVAGTWVEIGGKWYHFYMDGTLAVNTKIDGYTVGADGARKE